MSKINNTEGLNYLGGDFGSPPEDINIITCSPRQSLQEVTESDFIVVHNDEPFKVSIENLTLRYSLERLPIGTILDWMSDGQPPVGWAVLDGSTFDPVTYPELLTLLGDTVLPNFESHTTAMVDNVFPFNVPIGTNTGTVLKALTLENLPPHSHSYVDEFREYDGENESGGSQSNANRTILSTTRNTSEFGGSSPMTNVQSSILTNKIIKAVPTRDEFRMFFSTNDRSIFLPPSESARPFCFRLGDTIVGEELVEAPPFVPVYDLGNCPNNILFSYTTPLEVTNVQLARVGQRYTGQIDTLGGVNGLPSIPLFLDIRETVNNRWGVFLNVDNTTFEEFTESLDFPDCPDLATWPNPIIYEGEIYTIDSINAI